MNNSDYVNLKSIEGMIEKGEEVLFLRLFHKKSGRWIKVVADHRNIDVIDALDCSDRKASVSLSNIIDELVASKKQGDLVSIYGYSEEMKDAIEILWPKLNLLVFGAGHVGQTVALMGVILGYDVTLIDDRAEFATRKRIPDSRVRLVVGDYSEIIKQIKIGSNSAIVIVTRGHQYDESCLRNVIRSKAGYLGMIGSKRRTVSVINRLKSDGFSDIDFNRVHAPIGLNIGAKSPQEISVAIHAEIINHFSRSGHLSVR